MLFLLALAAAQGAPATVDTAVLARNIARGEALSTSDFESASLPASQARGSLAPAEAAGREATRQLMAGRPVRSGDVVAARVVRRGEPVTIAVVDGPLRITADGRALTDAGRGEPVRVVSLGTNRTLDAVAEAPGQVRLGGR